jgi:hypothetical protein
MSDTGSCEPLVEYFTMYFYIYFYLFYASSPDAAACRVCLPLKYGRCMLLIDTNLLLPGAQLPGYM